MESFFVCARYKEVVDSSVKETMDKLVRIGQKQYGKFVNGMVDSEKPCFNEPLTKNKLPIFRLPIFSRMQVYRNQYQIQVYLK